jgi:hypothetical protein
MSDFNRLYPLSKDQYKTESFIPLARTSFWRQRKKYLLDTIDTTFVSSVAYVDQFELMMQGITKQKKQ